MLVPEIAGAGLELGSVIANLFGQRKANDYVAEADAALNQQRVLLQRQQADYAQEQNAIADFASQQQRRVQLLRYKRYNLGGSVLAGTQE